MSIKINLKIFLFAIIFYFTKQIHIYAMLMFFAFCHEMGHLLCGIAVGLKPKSLKIMPVGLSVEFAVLPKEYNKKIVKANALQLKKLYIAIAGPITNILIVIVAFLIRNIIDNAICMEIIYSNLLIAFFNLMPIYPLDGARVIKSIIYIIEGRKNATKLTYYISNITMVLITMVSSIAIYYYQNIAILIIIIYLWGMVYLENKKYNLKNRIDKLIENC
jgi:stage IV sporulation protein FB